MKVDFKELPKLNVSIFFILKLSYVWAALVCNSYCLTYRPNCSNNFLCLTSISFQDDTYGRSDI